MTEAWKTLAEIQVQTPHPIVKDASHVVPPKQQKAAFAPARCPLYQLSSTRTSFSLLLTSNTLQLPQHIKAFIFVYFLPPHQNIVPFV